MASDKKRSDSTKDGEETKTQKLRGFFVSHDIYDDASAIFTHRLKPVSEIKETCFIVLDTNPLLVPYSVGRQSLEQIRKTYQRLTLSNILRIPGQVAREFADNRPTKLKELYSQLYRKRNINYENKGYYPLLEGNTKYQEVLEKERQLDALLKEYRKVVGELLNEVQSWTWNDPVSAMYNEVFTQEVVTEIEIDREKLRSDLQYRYTNNIPPGYKDDTKEDEGFGDLVIWYTILKLGEERDVIFVTGDEKTDWWYQSEKQFLYPRYELVDEFRRIFKGRSFHMMTFSELLTLYGANESVVQEIKREEQQQALLPRHSFISQMGYVAEQSVYEWLKKTYGEESVRKSHGLEERDYDFVAVDRDNTKY